MTTAQAESTIPTGTWQSDPVHSRVAFSVKHMVVATYRAGFDDFDIRLSDEDGQPKIRGEARVESIESRDEQQRAHLLSPDFFDAENHPAIRFASTDIRRDGDQLTVDGELTIKGNTRHVTAVGEISGPVVDIADQEKVGIDLETKVDRREYGLNWNAPLPKGGFAVENEVTLSVHLELVRAEA
jgi:polyisoprenoid-binding protein YceI